MAITPNSNPNPNHFFAIKLVFIKYNTYKGVTVHLVKLSPTLAQVRVELNNKELTNSFHLNTNEIRAIRDNPIHASYMAGLIDAHIYTQLAEAHNALPDIVLGNS